MITAPRPARVVVIQRQFRSGFPKPVPAPFLDWSAFWRAVVTNRQKRTTDNQ